MAQVASRCPLSAESWFLYHSCPCMTYGARSGTGTRFPPSIFLYIYKSAIGVKCIP
jgi:hypothetical protein